MILFDFRAPSVNSFNRKRRHIIIGIRIIIRIIYYPINRYPDSKLSVLSIPSILQEIYHVSTAADDDCNEKHITNIVLLYSFPGNPKHNQSY